MTRLLEQAVESLRALRPEAQDQLARLMLQFTGATESTADLTAAEKASFDESLAQAERGEFASDDAIRAIWAKHGL